MYGKFKFSRITFRQKYCQITGEIDNYISRTGNVVYYLIELILFWNKFIIKQETDIFAGDINIKLLEHNTITNEDLNIILEHVYKSMVRQKYNVNNTERQW